jgi:hypothetical protein
LPDLASTTIAAYFEEAAAADIDVDRSETETKAAKITNATTDRQLKPKCTL